MDNVFRSHSGYFNRAFEDLGLIEANMREALVSVEYDTMVGTGLSGTLVVPTLARAFGKYWAIVRKESSPHSYGIIEGEIGRKWLFVDDFVCTGGTRERVKKVVSCETTKVPEYHQYHTEYVGTYSYEPNKYERY